MLNLQIYEVKFYSSLAETHAYAFGFHDNTACTESKALDHLATYN